LINVIYLAVPVDELGKTIFFPPAFHTKTILFAKTGSGQTCVRELKKDPLSRRHALAGLGGGGRYASGCHAAAAWVHRGL
jgi:hypothetical protein